MAKSGLAPITANAIREIAETIIDTYITDNRIDKNGLQRAILQELVNDDHLAAVQQAVGEPVATHLFSALQFAIYEIVRHKIRNQKISVQTTSGNVIMLRAFHQIKLANTMRDARSTLNLSLSEIDRLIRERIKTSDTITDEIFLLNQARQKMAINPDRYPTLRAALDLNPINEQPETIAEIPYEHTK